MTKHQLHFGIFFLPFAHFIAIKTSWAFSRQHPILFLVVLLPQRQGWFWQKLARGYFVRFGNIPTILSKCPRHLLPDGGIGFGLSRADNIGLSAFNGFRGDGAKIKCSNKRAMRLVALSFDLGTQCGRTHKDCRWCLVKPNRQRILHKVQTAFCYCVSTLGIHVFADI